MNKLGPEWEIRYHPLVVKKDIPRLNKIDAKRVKSAIERKLTLNPVIYGIPLRGTLKQFWKLRVGDWRVIFTIKNKEVYILVIANRKEVYETAERRTC